MHPSIRSRKATSLVADLIWSRYHRRHASCTQAHVSSVGTLSTGDRDNGDGTHRLDAVSDCRSRSPGRIALERMALGSHGLRDVRHGRSGARPGHHRTDSHQGSAHVRHAGYVWNQRPLELLVDPVRRALILESFTGAAASRIPSSQSSVPRFIRNNLTRAKPAAFSHPAVSATR